MKWILVYFVMSFNSNPIMVVTNDYHETLDSCMASEVSLQHQTGTFDAVCVNEAEGGLNYFYDHPDYSDYEIIDQRYH